MLLGLVMIAMLGATSATAILFAYGFSWWMIILAYPVTGFLILLPGVALVAWVKHNPPRSGAGQLVTSQSPAIPRPQSPAGSSNP
ncbi:MAG: hypothetical protein EOP21_00420 [Hyphomicrobiales bacterium]|nr:MAG: hypothetical protein EOP21_00420 [Hyphomicrobiales bacterium]